MDDLTDIEKELYDLMIKSQNQRTTLAPSEYRIDMKGFIRGLHVALSIVRNKIHDKIQSQS